MSFKEAVVFDPNLWYQISEARVDKGGEKLNQNLQFSDSPPGFTVFPDDHNYWQFLPADDDTENRFFLRSQKTGTAFHLSACFNPDEEHEDKTGLCMLPADEKAEEQIWQTDSWGDGTTAIRFINIGNGSDYWLDCHKGSPPFMNDDIDTSNYKPAQRWLVSSVSAVEQASFKVGDGQPTATSSEAGPTSEPASPGNENDGNDGGSSGDDGGSSGLSTAASAGVGVGVGVFALGLVVAIFFLLRRRKQKNGKAAAAEMGDNDVGVKKDLTNEKGMVSPPPVEAPTPDTGAHEVHTTAEPAELDSVATPTYRR